MAGDGRKQTRLLSLYLWLFRPLPCCNPFPVPQKLLSISVSCELQAIFKICDNSQSLGGRVCVCFVCWCPSHLNTFQTLQRPTPSHKGQSSQFRLCEIRNLSRASECRWMCRHRHFNIRMTDITVLLFLCCVLFSYLKQMHIIHNGINFAQTNNLFAVISINCKVDEGFDADSSVDRTRT